MPASADMILNLNGEKMQGYRGRIDAIGPASRLP
jgi:hypothetical protein